MSDIYIVILGWRFYLWKSSQTKLNEDLKKLNDSYISL